jgi:hypothetical protein
MGMGLIGLRDRSHRLAIAILLIHMALSVLYSVVVPLWEAHDEWAHYEYVEHVARTRTLPLPGQRLTEEYEYDEATQPPLYYVLGALPVLAVSTDDDLVPMVNPYATRGTGEGGVNFAVHDPRIEGFPWKGTVLAAHLVRLVSAVVGTLGCVATYLLARLVWPRQPVLALGALTLHALAPQFLFINSVITNDVLVSALGGWTLYLAACMLLDPPRGLRALALCIVTAMAVLTKYTALALVPLAVLALALGLWRARRTNQIPLRFWRWLVPGLLTATALSTAWFWRNWRTTGRLLPRFSRQLAMLSEHGLVGNLAWENLPRLVQYGFTTFWASFGWGNVGPPKRVFLVLAVVCGLAVLGAMLGLWRERRCGRTWLVLGLLALDLGLVVALPLYQELRRGGVLLRGRYLLPALPSVALLLVWGLSRWLPRRAHAWLMVILALAAAGAALWVPLGLIRPSYAAPDIITEDDVPQTAQRLGVRFGDRAELVAYELWPEAVHPGEALAVTLWWRALASMPENYTVGVHLLAAGEQSYASRNHYPGGGNFATSLWRPGDMFAETHWLETSGDLPVPSRGQVAVTLFLDDSGQRHLPASSPAGDALGERALFGRVALRQTEPTLPQVPTEVMYTLEEEGGGRISLLGYGGGFPVGPLGRTVPLTLFWRSEEPTATDYTVFVHLRDGGGERVYGQDSPPVHGHYPTDLWDSGELVQDERVLRLPLGLARGRFEVSVGLYRLEDGVRLAAFDSAGRRLPDDAIPLLELEVANEVYQGFLPFLLR